MRANPDLRLEGENMFPAKPIDKVRLQNLREPETGEYLPMLATQERRATVTAALAAKLLGKSRDTIYRWMEQGKLSGRKIGGRWYVYRDSIEAEWNENLVERG